MRQKRFLLDKLWLLILSVSKACIDFDVLCDCVGQINTHVFLNTYTIDFDFHTLMIKKEWVLGLYKDDVMYVTWFFFNYYSVISDNTHFVGAHFILPWISIWKLRLSFLFLMHKYFFVHEIFFVFTLHFHINFQSLPIDLYLEQ